MMHYFRASAAPDPGLAAGRRGGLPALEPAAGDVALTLLGNEATPAAMRRCVPNSASISRWPCASCTG